MGDIIDHDAAHLKTVYTLFEIHVQLLCLAELCHNIRLHIPKQVACLKQKLSIVSNCMNHF